MTISGIYRIDGPNGGIYIGSSKNVNYRWSEHKRDLRKGKHSSPHFQNAWNMYGESAFTFSVIEVVDNPRAIEENSKARIINREQYWLDWLFETVERNRIYNTQRTAGSNLGIILSEETKAKMSAARKGRKPTNYNALRSDEAKEKHRLAMKNRVLTEEHKQRISESNKGKNSGKVLSVETRNKLAKTYTLTSPNNETITIHNLRLFCIENDLSYAKMNEVSNGKRKSYKGWKKR